MSADGWARCPYCIAKRRAEDEAARQRVADAYGEVPAEEYVAMRAALPDAFDPWGVEAELREDYELGFGGTASEDTEATISYRAGCRTCGASATFEGTVTLTPGSRDRRP